jgi:hypothetical protein
MLCAVGLPTLQRISFCLFRHAAFFAFVLSCLALASSALAEQSVTLAWDPNPETDIGGYIVYYGSASRNYTNAINVGNVTTNTVRGLVDGATYFFAVTAYNTNGLESDFSDEVSYSSAGGNLPPLVNAGPDQNLTLPATATLHGTATDDGKPNPPGVIATAWSKVSGPGTVTFANAASTNTTAAFSAAGTYVLRLTASDSVLSASDNLTVVVSAPATTNTAPLVNAGPDLSIILPTVAALHGTATDDGKPNPPGLLTTTWSKVSGPGTVTFTNAAVLNTTASFSAAGTYVLRLTASDSVLSGSDELIVVVSAAGATNTAPLVNAGPDQTIYWPAAATLHGTATDDGKPNPPGVLTTTWSKVSGPGTVTFGNAAALTTTATFSAPGTYVLRLTASDSALSASGVVTITVRPNTPPFISDISAQTTREDTSVEIPFVVWDTETPADELILLAYSSNEGLVAGADIFFDGSGSNRTARVVPQPGQAGEVTLAIEVTDSAGESAWAVFDLYVTPANTPPTISEMPPQLAQANEALTVAFEVDDRETPAYELALEAFSYDERLVASAEIELGGEGHWRTATIYPRPNQWGRTTLVLVVTDLDGATAYAEFDLIVNRRPVISDIAPQTTPEYTPLLVHFTASDAETPPSALVISAYSFNEQLVSSDDIFVDGHSSNFTALIFPQPGQWGETTLAIVVTDAEGASATAEFSLTVTPANTPPAISDIRPQAVLENEALTVTFAVGDRETPASDLFVEVFSFDEGLVASADIELAGSGAQRTATIYPRPNQWGQTTLLLVVTDPDGASAWAEFDLRVNRRPVISAIAPQTTPENTPLLVQFTASDAETPPSALVISAYSFNEQLVASGDIFVDSSGSNHTAMVLPQPNQRGETTLAIVVTDGHGGSATAEFSLTITRANHPPTLSAILPQVTPVNSAVSVAFVVGDVESPAAALTLAATSSNPELVSAAGIQLGGSGSNRTATLQPQPDRWGEATIRISVTDPGGASTWTEFLLTVKPQSYPPTISAMPAQSSTDGALTMHFFTVNDRDTSLNLLTVKAKSSNQALVPDANLFLTGVRSNRAISVSPVPRRLGETTITVTVSDGVNATSSSFVLTVRAPLRIERHGAQAVLRWDANNARLQEADSVTGPWRDVMPILRSPVQVAPARTKVYRLRAE